MTATMMDSGTKTKKISRPTEEKALARVAKEALRRGISQVELLNRLINSHNSSGICHCPFCRRSRAGLI